QNFCTSDSWRTFRLPLKLDPQAAQRYLRLGEGLLLPTHGNGDVAVSIALQVAGELLAAIPGLIELYQHRAAQKLFKIPGALEDTLGPGGRNLKGIAAFNGIRLVQQIADHPAYRLAVLNIHAALLIEVQ